MPLLRKQPTERRRFFNRSLPLAARKSLTAFVDPLSKINASEFVIIYPLINQIRRIRRTTNLQTSNEETDLLGFSFFQNDHFRKSITPVVAWSLL
jgi:hypothetical protein